MSNQPEQLQQTDEITLKELILKLRKWHLLLVRKWKWIVLFTILGALAGISYALFKKPLYTAKISFVTDTNQSNTSGISAYAGVAAQFGINIGSGNLSGGLFTGDNIYDLMTTRLMLEETLLSPVEIGGKRTLLIDYYIQIEKLREKWHDSPGLENISFDIDTAKFTLKHNGIISDICKTILAKNLIFPTKSTGSIMSVSCASKSEIFSALFLEKLINHVAQFYITTKTEKARANLDVLQKQLDSVRTQLYGAMSNVASFQDLNQNLVRQEPRVQQQRSSLKMQVNSAIYQQIVPAIETAKMILQKETPLFEIIDKPILPLDKNQPSKVKWGIAGALLGIFLSSVWILIRNMYYEIIKTGN